MGRKSRNYREQTLSREFDHPEYITQRPSQLRRYLGDIQRRPDLANWLARGTVGTTLISISYQEESTRRHVDIAECPRNESVQDERGRYERQTKEKRRQVGPETTFYYIRWVGETAMYREQLVRMIRALAAEGAKE